MKKSSLLAAVLAAMSVSAALAAPADRSGTQGLYIDAGTLGAGIGYQYGVTDGLFLRAGANYGKYSYDTTDKNVKYDGDLKMNSYELVADFYPSSGSGFRLSGGVIWNKNKISLKATPTGAGTIDVNGVTYTTNAGAEARLEAQFNKNNVSPYVGFGWTSGANKNDGLHFKADFGVLYQKPSATLTLSGVNDAGGTLEANRQQAQSNIQSDLDKAKFYPVIKIGMTYNF